MPSLLTTTKLLLPLLSLLGFYLTWYLLFHNATQSHMVSLRDRTGPRLLPSTTPGYPIKTSYIGVSWFDYQLTVLDLFFWSVVDGSMPHASLFCYHFAGQVFVGWGLLVVESLRGGNQGRRRWAVSAIVLWGVALQNLAYAVIIPIYLVIHLTMSPTVQSRRVADYAVKVIDAYSIPLTMMLGFALPSVLMALPAPSVLGFETKQNFMAVWQFFPVWVSILQPVVAFFVAIVAGDRVVPPKGSAASTTSGDSIKALRFVYTALLIVGGVNQLSTLSAVALSEFFPALFAPGYVGGFNFSKVFVPAGITPATKMKTIGEGALVLLQWDHYTGSAAIALWASVLLVQARRERGGASGIYGTKVLYGVVAFILTGPLGFAVAALWARDELVFGNEIEEKKTQ